MRHLAARLFYPWMGRRHGRRPMPFQVLRHRIPATLTSGLKAATRFAATGWHTLPSVPRRRALQSFNNFE
jgi:hypothetical protein